MISGAGLPQDCSVEEPVVGATAGARSQHHPETSTDPSWETLNAFFRVQELSGAPQLFGIGQNNPMWCCRGASVHLSSKFSSPKPSSHTCPFWNTVITRSRLHCGPKALVGCG